MPAPGSWYGPSPAALPRASTEIHRLTEYGSMSTEKGKTRSGLRTVTDHSVTVLAILATVIVIAPLVAIFVYLLYMGASSVNLAFFTQVPKPPGEVGGGMANAIVGSAVLLAVASLIGIPLGIGGRHFS